MLEMLANVASSSSAAEHGGISKATIDTTLSSAQRFSVILAESAAHASADCPLHAMPKPVHVMYGLCREISCTMSDDR